ncbi:helix-turn-helix domain-containing protein, partial [Paracoccus salipaludis]|uniref:helix-turn-helix domain-containing protein n=1 Tax=Paracoccus salipaludis TaxID=2032623 RepID=UPI001071F1D0
MVGLAAILSTALGAAVVPSRRSESYDILRAQLGAYGHATYDLGGVVHHIAPESHWTREGNNLKNDKKVKTGPDATGAISDLRRRSGLTIKQVSDVLGVSPKTIHNWQNGGAISSENMEHLGRVLDAIRYVDRGEGALTKALLLTEGDGNSILLDLLKDKRFTEFRALAGKGIGRVDSKKFLMISKPVESAGQQLLALSEGEQDLGLEEELSF